MGVNLEVAATVNEHLGRIESLISALKCKPQLGPLPESVEPSNKKIEPQRRFLSTKLKPKKRKVEAVSSKPNDQEKSFIVQTLGGNVQVISSSSVGNDHDYLDTPGDLVRFEHSY